MMNGVMMQPQAAAERGELVRGDVSRCLASVRRALKHMLWAVRGLAISNPPLPTNVTSILFVCTGNICRSPFAALLTHTIANEERHRSIRCASAGLKPSADGRCPTTAVASAKSFGVELAHHTPIGVDDTLIAEHDLIVVMEAAHLSTVRRRWPQHRSRVVLLALFDPGPVGKLDPFEQVNIPDPFGKDDAAFDRCYRRVEASVRELLSSLQ